MRIFFIFLGLFFLSQGVFYGEDHAPAPQAAACRDCHGSETDSFSMTAHAKESDCKICHLDPDAHLSAQDKKGNIFNPASQGVQKSNSVCLNCHSDKEKDIEERFKAAPTLHDDLRCQDCHKVHLGPEADGVERDSFRANLSVDCASCHRREADHLSASAHGNARMSCSDCHKLHEVGTVSRDMEEEIGKCLSCHAAQELEFKQSFTHPLREKGIRCSDCHDPHNGTFPGMLKAEGDRACADCHADTLIEGGRHPASKNTNHPLQTVKCMDCHLPHGSVFRKVLKHDEDVLCHTCHK